MTLMSTVESLSDSDAKVPSNIVGLEAFSLGTKEEDNQEEIIDADSLFKLPNEPTKT